MNLEQVLVADDKSEVSDFTGTILYVGKAEKNEKGKSKTRQTIAIGESEEKSIWVTVWDGSYTMEVKGAKAVISKATVEIYKEKRRLTTNAKNVTITDIPAKPATEKTKEEKPSPAGQVQTGAVNPKLVPETGSEKDKTQTVAENIEKLAIVEIMDKLIEYYEKKLLPKNYTTEDIMTTAHTVYIEINKRIRRDKY